MWITALILLFLFVPYFVLPWYAFFFYLYVMYFAPMPSWIAWRFPLWDWLRDRLLFSVVLVPGSPYHLDALKHAKMEVKKNGEPHGCMHLIHRHGPFNLAHGLAFIFEPLRQHVWTLYASQLMFVPFMSLFLRARGRTASVAESNIRRIIKQGEEVSLCPGGISEMYLPEGTVKRRSGFLRIAWDLKCPVVPYYSEGENVAYETHTIFPACWQRWMMNNFGYEIFHIVRGAPWFFPVAPRCVRLTLRAGEKLFPASFATLEQFREAYYLELARIAPNTPGLQFVE